MLWYSTYRLQKLVKSWESGNYLVFQPLNCFMFSLSLCISQINLKTGMYGMKASLMTVIRKLVSLSQRRLCALVSLWTIITMLFARTFYQDMPLGVALLEDFFMMLQLKLPKMVDLRPCWMSVPIQRSDMVDSKLQKNCVNILDDWVTMWGSWWWVDGQKSYDSEYAGTRHMGKWVLKVKQPEEEIRHFHGT